MYTAKRTRWRHLTAHFADEFKNASATKYPSHLLCKSRRCNARANLLDEFLSLHVYFFSLIYEGELVEDNLLQIYTFLPHSNKKTLNISRR